MEQKLKSKIGVAVEAWLAQDHPDHTQNKLAELSGVNARYIIPIRKGEHTIKQSQGEGQPDKEIDIRPEHYYRLAQAVGYNLEFKVNFDIDPNFQKIQNLCKFVQGTMRTGLIDSQASGDGKTSGTEHYSQEHKNVIYIKVTHKMKGNDLLLHLVKVMKIKEKEQRISPARRIQLISEHCVGRPGLLIILDELEDCDKDIWRIIKDITDAIKGRCGIILCGLGLTEMLSAGNLKGKDLFPQLDRRYRANRVLLREINKPLIKDLCHHNGIDDLGAIKVMQDICQDRGMLAEYIKDIHTILIKEGHPVNKKTVGDILYTSN